MGPTKPSTLKTHDTLVDIIDVQFKNDREHWLDMGAAAVTFVPNFGTADKHLLVNSQSLLDYDDYGTVMICVTLHLTNLLCGFSHTRKPLGTPKCRLLSDKLLKTWDSKQPLITEIRDQSSEILELITQIKEDPDFTPTVKKMGILFAQFGTLLQTYVYPEQYLPMGTNIARFPTYPIKPAALTQLLFQIAQGFRETATGAEFTAADDVYFSSQASTVLKFISCTLTKRSLELDSEDITQAINHLLNAFQLPSVVGCSSSS